jgi:uncharacterized protein (UPF0147 family)
MEIVNEAGDTELWKFESAGISNLIANGWSKDFIGPGNTITIEARPLRNGKPGGLIRWVTLDNGLILATREMPDDADAPVYASSNEARESEAIAFYAGLESPSNTAERKAAWMAREKRSRPAQLPAVDPASALGALDPDNLAKDRPAPPFDMTGVWNIRSDREHAKFHNANVWDFPPLPKLTAKAQKTHDEYLAATASGVRYADSTAYCYPPGMPRIQTRAGAFMAIQMPTAIYIVHRFNNDFRTIYLDGREHIDPAIRIDSYNGDAVGRWEDDHLFSDVVGFGQEQHWIQRGIPIGTEFRMTERYYMLNDNNTLAIQWTFVDPEHWEGEWIHTKFWDRLLHKDIEEANCLASDNAALPGL